MGCVGEKGKREVRTTHAQRQGRLVVVFVVGKVVVLVPVVVGGGGLPGGLETQNTPSSFSERLLSLLQESLPT